MCFYLQYTPYKKGSKLTKARRAKALGLEDAATALLNVPHTLDLSAWVKPGTEGRKHLTVVAYKKHASLKLIINFTIV